MGHQYMQGDVKGGESEGHSWSQYVGHIVRWQDGKVWFVKEDGRHRITNETIAQRLLAAGSQVYDLPASELQVIPDMRGQDAE